MNLTAADIDRIVAEVVRRLRAMTAGSSSSVAAASELRLSERVITLGTLKGRLDGISKVVVIERAVVTPAVKDELKQQKIAWERATTKARS
jgi:hypothetical protein